MLFTETSIGSMEIRNRFVRSATWEGLADSDGFCTPELVEMMRDLASGGVGLIISSHMYVSPEGQASLRQVAIDSDEAVPGLSRMVEAVHGEGGAIAAQLAHGGCHAASRLTGLEPEGPSVTDEKDAFFCREMTLGDIAVTVDAFARAAGRALRAGFDAIQIHAAHGYLLSQFLSPHYNKRKDLYGGSIENRSRFLVEVFRAVREATGPDYPVLVKLNSQDYIKGGLSLDDMLEVSRLLQDLGADAIEMSGGTVNEGSKYKFSRKLYLESEDEEEVYYLDEARRYKKECQVPLILVGGIRSFRTARKLLSDGLCNFISMSRPFIREPHLVNRWGSGDDSPATCISCNACFRPARRGEGLYCVVEDCLRRGKQVPE